MDAERLSCDQASALLAGVLSRAACSNLKSRI